ncbi:MAG: phenylalanine--tRNA ligase subunit beta [Nanoarchaeota archaeon]
MPTIELSKKDLEELIGKKFTIEQIKNLLEVVKGEIEGIDGDRLRVEIKDINRPDLWSTSGIAHELRGELGKETGLVKFNIKRGTYEVYVSNEMKSIRPLTVCAVVKNLKLDSEGIKQIIQLQEKLSENFGREREELALGIYDADKIEWPIHFKAFKPDELKFVPLEFNVELYLNEILQRHPTGRKYADLLKGLKKYPIFIDSASQVLSMPPIINSELTGRITEKTRNAFVEVSGHSFRFIMPALLVFISELASRKCEIQSVTVNYGNRRIITPDFKEKKITLKLEYVNKILGTSLTAAAIKNLLGKRRMDAKTKSDMLEVTYGAYRQDIMHARDIAEDVSISYGYNKFFPRVPMIATIGKASEIEGFSERIATFLTGLDMQEIATFTLTSKENLFKKMNLKEQRIIELENPISQQFTCLRNWLTPSILEFLARNKKARYPHRIFEIGDCATIKDSKVNDVKRIAVAISHPKANFTEARQMFEYLLDNLGITYVIKETQHNSFIDGRVARISVKAKGNVKQDVDVAYVGEISPLVLKNWNLTMPVSVFELNLNELLNVLR